MKTDELTPCPFCGEHEELELRVESGDTNDMYYYQCGVCGATGPVGYDIDGAAYLWNGRDDDA